jgi:hypothetical protein
MQKHFTGETGDAALFAEHRRARMIFLQLEWENLSGFGEEGIGGCSWGMRADWTCTWRIIINGFRMGSGVSGANDFIF